MAVPSRAMLGIIWAQLIVQAFFVFCRFWIRKFKLKSKLALPDYMILLSLFWIFIGTILMTLLTLLDIKAEGAADDAWELMIPFLALSMADMARYMKYTVSITVCYYSAVWSAKASFLAMYFALGEKLGKKMRMLLLVASIFTGVTWVAIVIINLMWCRPLSRTWEVVVPIDPQYCMYLDLPVLGIHFAFNISTDLFLLLFSLILLRSVHMQRREAAGFAFVILIGSISIVGAIARLAVILPHWDNYVKRYEWKQKAAILSMVEQSSAIIACCLPAFRLFLRDKKAKTTSRTSRDEEAGFVNPAFPQEKNKKGRGKKNMVAVKEVEEDIDRDRDITPWDIPGIALAPYAEIEEEERGDDGGDVRRYPSFLESRERVSDVPPSLGNEPLPRTAWGIPGIESGSETSVESCGRNGSGLRGKRTLL
ncbi:hypothetical protein L873DRAFT_1663442 [Choiromyces venosus 120613-1]|uniref:Rhodopsin domain-containing protein n=1 Tax=Choiromyces venosus 120613-1 TaxID=1336337 RepID=A0A3N4K3Z6_9PEZI|nr:hypothetical protein L873DRAFT_1663442 [Choiromyces venosus 120613-1]